MFCGNCGKEITGNAKFCPNCGARILAPGAPAAAQAFTAGAPAGVQAFSAGTQAVAGIAPGFSDRANHPEILAAVKKNRKASKVFMLFLVPLPIIGFVIYSLASGEMELKNALLIGGIVSLVFLIFAIIGLIKGKAESSYDAVVIGKGTKEVYYHRNNSDTAETVTEYHTTVMTDAGKTITIKEREGSRILAYSYLKEGDRFRYHPQFAFPYELYDKSKASCLYCAGCGTKNPVGNDRCKKCGLPLIK